MALCRELTTRSLPYIGKVYGNRDHTTVLHACRRIDELRKTDPLIDEDYCNIKWALSYSADECSWMQPTEWAASVFRDAA
jgi:ATPase involved in DNA replication initiation